MFLDRSVERYPQRPALRYFGKSITYRQLSEEVNRFATALNHLGVKKGDRVAIHLPNCPQAVIAYYAILKRGAIVVETSPLYVEREIAHQWNDAGTLLVITLDLFLPAVKKAATDAKVERIIVCRIDDYFPLPLKIAYRCKTLFRPRANLQSDPRCLSFKQLLTKNFPRVDDAKIDPGNDLALLQYTGGTTGVSKGVMLTHRNVVSNVLQVRAWFHEAQDGKEIFIGVLPLFHIFGMNICMNFPLSIGATILLLPKFELQPLLRAINRCRPTVFAGVPAMFTAILNAPSLHNCDFSSLKFCVSGAAPLPKDVIERFEKATGAPLIEGYGLSEASPVTHCNPLSGTRRAGAIGLPLPDTDAKIVDLHDNKKELPRGEAGELAVRGPQVMRGYWHQDEETARVLQNEFLYTGDIAIMDGEGYFTIVGRKKEMIIVGGFNVYPSDVEETLNRHPAVAESAVVGLPDPVLGEIVKAHIVLREGAKLSVDEIMAYCKENLAKYKVPKVVQFRDSLPKNPLGKVLKWKLVGEEKSGEGNRHR